MQKKIFVLLVPIILLFAQCTNKQIRYFTERGLPSTFYTIDITKDTVLHTAKGALINIPKGTLNAGGATTVKLEVKEAYSIADIITAGLTTRSGKQLLSSGGMIYVNPVEKGVTIAKAIGISIPTDKQEPGMKLYKGEYKADSSIDWTAPQPLPEQAFSKRIQRGKMLFQANCASCHDPLNSRTGPPLAFVDKRRHKDWLYAFVHNSSKMIAEGDQQANCVYNAFGKTAMTAFPNLTNDEIQSMFDYIDGISGPNPFAGMDIPASIDSCVIYNKAKALIEQERNRLIVGNGKRVEYVIPANAIIITHPFVPPPGFEDVGNGKTNMVQAENEAAVYYEFKIEGFGWYNIDALTNETPGIVNSELEVKLTGAAEHDVNLFLILPSNKIMVNGGLIAGMPGVYGFFADDGRIPLPQNVTAYILAMGEKDGKVLYGLTQFTTTTKQSLQITVAPSTKEAINAAIAKLGMDGIKIKAEDTKNADSIRITDQQLKNVELLKPKGADCNCGLVSESDSVRWE